jgi:hypothetical protein
MYLWSANPELSRGVRAKRFTSGEGHYTRLGAADYLAHRPHLAVRVNVRSHQRHGRTLRHAVPWNYLYFIKETA